MNSIAVVIEFLLSPLLSLLLWLATSVVVLLHLLSVMVFVFLFWLL